MDNKEKMGKATFSIYPTMSIEEVENKINEQIELCKYTLNKSLTIATGYQYRVTAIHYAKKSLFSTQKIEVATGYLTF